VTASCFSTWDGAGLMVARITVIATAGYVAQLAWRAMHHRSLHIVPRPVWAFTGAWATVLLLLAGWATVNCETPRETWYIAVYGSAFVWTMVGLIWAIHIGERRYRASIAAAEAAAERARAVLADPENIL
jgi:hypothetical protein